MNTSACFLVEDLLLQGRIFNEHIVTEVAELRWNPGVLFFGFGRVNFRGGLDINLGLGGLRNTQGPPQYPVNSDEEPER